MNSRMKTWVGHKTDPRPRDRRRGVALVIVLGFLSVLTALAVGFAVTMRIERLSSNVYYHGARTRQFVHLGLARAMDEIDHEILTAGVYPTQSSYASTAGAGVPNPPLISLTTDTNPQDVDAYIPHAVFPSDATINQGRWIDITDPDNNRIGRYAWIAVNCSGLLDANTIGAEDERVHGRDPGELQAHSDLLPEFADASDVDEFRDNREDEWIRFESIDEVAHAFAPPVPRTVTELFSYSLFPAGYYDEDESQAAQSFYIGDTAAIEDGEARIIEHFEDMGLSAENARMTWENLADYVDGGLEPRNLESFGTKPVPMLNEFAVLTRIRHDGGVPTRTWTLDIGVRTELWYPFCGPDTDGEFTVRVTPEIDGDFSAPAGSNQTTTLGTWNASQTVAGVFDVLTHVFQATAQTEADPAAVPPVLVPPEPDLNALRLRFSVHEGDSDGGPEVDRLQTDFIEWDAHFARTNEIAQDRGTRWEADDPRINWRWNNEHWEAADVRTNNMATLQSNLGRVNDRVSFADAGKDGTWHMYVRRGPLQVAGELGFLLYDAAQPWTTIRLTGVNALPVLDRFAVHEEPARRGLVNVNSEVEEVRASVFVGAPIERWPSTAPGAERDPDWNTITPAQARALAGALQDEQPFTNLSEISRADFASAVGGLDVMQIESLARNSGNLLSARQNLFTIVVAAQSMIEDEVMGEARAVAVIWRDPYETESEPGGSLMNRSFIRFFRWLDE